MRESGNDESGSHGVASGVCLEHRSIWNYYNRLSNLPVLVFGQCLLEQFEFARWTNR